MAPGGPGRRQRSLPSRSENARSSYSGPPDLPTKYTKCKGSDLDRELSLEAALAESSRRLGNALAAPGSSPSEHAGRQELELRLADALSRLPADYAEVILLRNVEALPHEEVARRMGRGTGAVRMLWVRALARLREELRLSTDAV